MVISMEIILDLTMEIITVKTKENMITEKINYQ